MAVVSANNYTIGGVDLYFAATTNHVKLDSGTTNGIGSDFRTDNKNLGNIVVAEFAPDITFLEHFITTSAGDKRKDHMVTSGKNITIPFTFDEMNEANLRKYFQGGNTTASTGTATPTFKVMSNTLEYGSAQLRFRTDIGQDIVYMIPKCIVRPDGNLAMNIEDWWTAPMVIEILYNTWTPNNLASDIDAPYGLITTLAIS